MKENMDMQTVVITGTNRGIGLELTKQFYRSGEWRVLACCRTPEHAEELCALQDQSNRTIEVFPLNVTDDVSIASFAEQIAGRPVDVLLNNAGIIGGDRQSARDTDYDAWLETFKVNTIAPFKLVQTLIGNLRLSNRARVMTVSSQMGALSRKRGGSYAYRSSKAAVNKVMQGLAIDLEADDIIVSMIHPGWVQTDMGGETADITPQESARGIFKVICSLTHNDNGRFFQWNGEEHPW